MKKIITVTIILFSLAFACGQSAETLSYNYFKQLLAFMPSKFAEGEGVYLPTTFILDI